MTTFDERLRCDPRIGARVFAGAYGLVLHRMMRDGIKHWDDCTEDEKLSACVEAMVVLNAADRVGV